MVAPDTNDRRKVPLMKWIKLSNQEIDSCVTELIDYFTQRHIEKKEITRNRLLLEEILLKYQDHFGEDQSIRVNFTRILNQVRCYIYLPGEGFNPLENDEDDNMSGMMAALLDYEGGTPDWSYHNGANVIFLSTKIKKNTSLISRIAVALGIGIAAGFAARALLAPDTALMLVNDYLQPLAGAYTGLLCVMAVLLTFFVFPLGISTIGNASAVGRISGKTVLRMYTISVAIVLTYAVIFLIAGRSGNSGDAAISGKSLFDILISMIPTGLVAPFLDFNPSQILIIGLMFGLAFLAMGEKSSNALELFSTCNFAAVLTNNYLNTFIPVYVAISAVSMIITADIAALLRIPQLIIYTFAGFLLLIVLYTAYLSIHFQVDPVKMFRRLMPGFLICLSSGSFGAAYATTYGTLLSLNADGNTAGFVFNIGSVIFKPAHTITFLVSSVLMASAFNVSISLPWLLFASFLAVIMAAAVPLVPGASASIYALIFTQLGLPNAAVVFMISINAFLDFVMSAVNQYCLQAEVLIQGCDELKL